MFLKFIILSGNIRAIKALYLDCADFIHQRPRSAGPTSRKTGLEIFEEVKKLVRQALCTLGKWEILQVSCIKTTFCTDCTAAAHAIVLFSHLCVLQPVF